MNRTIAGQHIEFSDDGFMTDMQVWTQEIAVELAKEYGIELSEKHIAVLEFVRKKHREGVEMTLRLVGSSGITDIKEMYVLFPKRPLKLAALIAGIPKPSGCL
ncbi:MAG TPA: TusE/DsrC/DsvC family sulfur relay protein [Saprospiraceae bacterium]|nr:TusE/DsrC/DsvC family sulfur relay protein [Saprospiraceae bacterium]